MASPKRERQRGARPARTVPPRRGVQRHPPLPQDDDGLLRENDRRTARDPGRSVGGALTARTLAIAEDRQAALVDRMRAIVSVRQELDNLESWLWRERADFQDPTLAELGAPLGLNRQAAWKRSERMLDRWRRRHRREPTG